ncbi:MAG TPA: type IV secretion system DNA-binding domain-containing protein [Candidatus Sulfotelmatobacter sp.]|jgi:type IV secretory pathway TraG/TraD family ATPase VirD4|nr:type IV secretion system DNA-binding domain-containing protein [Candidatus Sulfotelmatobacter sp.]
MTQKWGRARFAGKWPSRKPWWSIAVFFVAVFSVGLIGDFCRALVWTPLQRYYSPIYTATEDYRAGRELHTYKVLILVTPAGSRLAVDTDVVERGECTFALSDQAIKSGALRVEWQSKGFENARLYALLRHQIYRDKSLLVLSKPAWLCAVLIFVGGLFLAIPKDLARARRLRNGRRLKGPELVTTAQFNRRNKSDGIGFQQQQNSMFTLGRRGQSLRIPRRIESSHILIMGDTGTGKSALIRQLLVEVEKRGEIAVIYDPALEYTPQFFDPSRGDVILNPLDGRMPYWTPGGELRHDAEALTLAASLFPDRHNENPFFVEGPRKIFAHLLTFHPTPEELVWWMSHPEEIDTRVKGTEYEAIIDSQSPPQRNGVLGSLNMVADALKLLPPEKSTTQSWSALEWSKERRGWLFLTSTPETRKRLLPLMSLWLDTLVLRLMNQGNANRGSVWLILDELASLQKLPQLHTAVTENRKSNNPVVLGFQGRSQLETRYGHEAEAMLSQPATKIFLRTSEPRAAKWVSETIGEIEIERLRESRSTAHNPKYSTSKSYNLDRQVEPLVMASEITGLEPLNGFLKNGNLVARMSFPYIELPEKQPKFIERPSPAVSGIVPGAPPKEKKDDSPAQKLSPQEVKQTRQKQLNRVEQQRFFE